MILGFRCFVAAPNRRILSKKHKLRLLKAQSSKTHRIGETQSIDVNRVNSASQSIDVNRVNSVDQSIGKLQWFSDPYLLAAKVTKSVKNAEYAEACQMVKRHTGAANAEVYGALFAALASKRQWQLALEMYEHMKTRKLQLTSKAVTTILGCIGQVTQNDGMYAEAVEVWEASEQNTIQANAMIKCLSGFLPGSLQKALAIYDRVLKGKSKNPKTRKTGPDLATFNTMLSLCAELDSGENGLVHGLPVWNKALELKRDRKLQLDSALIRQLILIYIRCSDKAKAEEGIAIACRYFGLPSSLDSSSHSPEFPLCPKSLTVLLHLTARVRYPALGVRWFNIAVQERGVEMDEGVVNAIASTLLSTSQIDQAWKLVQQSSPRFHFHLGLRVAAAAAPREDQDCKLWLARAKALFDNGRLALEKGDDVVFGFREALNRLSVAVTCKNWPDASEVILQSPSLLVHMPISQLELFVRDTLGKASESVYKTGKTPVRIASADLKMYRLSLELCRLVFNEFIKAGKGDKMQRASVMILQRHVVSGLALMHKVKSPTSHSTKHSANGYSVVT